MMIKAGSPPHGNDVSFEPTGSVALHACLPLALWELKESPPYIG